MKFKVGDRVGIRRIDTIGTVLSIATIGTRDLLEVVRDNNPMNEMVFDYDCVFLNRTLCLGPVVSLANYPHKCPSCGEPAYIGFNSIDCSGKCK